MQREAKLQLVISNIERITEQREQLRHGKTKTSIGTNVHMENRSQNGRGESHKSPTRATHGSWQDFPTWTSWSCFQDYLSSMGGNIIRSAYAGHHGAPTGRNHASNINKSLLLGAMLNIWADIGVRLAIGSPKTVEISNFDNGTIDRSYCSFLLLQPV